MNDLITRMCSEQPVEVRLRPKRTAEAFKEQIERGTVHLRFPGTRGGTELSVHTDSKRSDVSEANFDEGTGSVKLVGNLTLNYVRVQCFAEIQLDSLTGTGHLETTEADAE